MKFPFSTLIVFTLISVSCSDASRAPAPAEDKREMKVMPASKPPSSFADTLQIDVPAAVFYTPDSLQLTRIKAITGRDAFESEQHNCFYLMRNARIVLKKYWPSIRLIESSHARYLLFIKDNKGSVLIDLDSQGDMCGIFMFNGQKAPELADMMNIDTALGFYFGQ